MGTIEIQFQFAMSASKLLPDGINSFVVASMDHTHTSIYSMLIFLKLPSTLGFNDNGWGGDDRGQRHLPFINPLRRQDTLSILMRKSGQKARLALRRQGPQRIDFKRVELTNLICVCGELIRIEFQADMDRQDKQRLGSFSIRKKQTKHHTDMKPPPYPSPLHDGLI